MTGHAAWATFGMTPEPDVFALGRTTGHVPPLPEEGGGERVLIVAFAKGLKRHLDYPLRRRDRVLVVDRGAGPNITRAAVIAPPSTLVTVMRVFSPAGVSSTVPVIPEPFTSSRSIVILSPSHPPSAATARRSAATRHMLVVYPSA